MGIPEFETEIRGSGCCDTNLGAHDPRGMTTKAFQSEEEKSTRSDNRHPSARPIDGSLLTPSAVHFVNLRLPALIDLHSRDDIAGGSGPGCLLLLSFNV